MQLMDDVIPFHRSSSKDNDPAKELKSTTGDIIPLQGVDCSSGEDPLGERLKFLQDSPGKTHSGLLEFLRGKERSVCIGFLERLDERGFRLRDVPGSRDHYHDQWLKTLDPAKINNYPPNVYKIEDEYKGITPPPEWTPPPPETLDEIKEDVAAKIIPFSSKNLEDTPNSSL